MQIKKKIYSKLQTLLDNFVTSVLILREYWNLFTPRKCVTYIYKYTYIIPFGRRVGAFAVGIGLCRQMAPWNEAGVGASSYERSFWNAADNCDTQTRQYLILRHRINFEYVSQTAHTSFITATSKCSFRWSLQLIF